MAYVTQGFGCSGDCGCTKCGGSRLGERYVRPNEDEEDAPQTEGFGCAGAKSSGRCGCVKCGCGRLGERYVRPGEDDDDDAGRTGGFYGRPGIRSLSFFGEPP